MMRFIIASFAGSLATLVSGTIIAIVMQPWVAPLFGALIRKEQEDGLLFSSLIAGYVVIGFCLSYLAPKLGVKEMRYTQILLTGAVLGLAIFLGDHLVTAGWSRLNVGAMLISGLSDSVSVMVGFATVAWVQRYQFNGSTSKEKR